MIRLIECKPIEKKTSIVNEIPITGVDQLQDHMGNDRYCTEIASAAPLIGSLNGLSEGSNSKGTGIIVLSGTFANAVLRS
jgi:hypothetical protein